MGKLLTLLLLLILAACQTESQTGLNALKKAELITPSGESIETTLAITAADQEQGLSGTKSEDFSENKGMLFYYLTEEEKHFWMPDTYFDLDLFYLDKDLKILDIIRKLPFYVGRANPDLIPRARSVWCRHTLEMKSGSTIGNKLKIGDVLQWNGKIPLTQMDNEVSKLLNGAK